MFFGFRSQRILWDYLEDGKLLVRVSQVMRRVGLAELPGDFGAILPQDGIAARYPRTGVGRQLGRRPARRPQAAGLNAAPEP
jgi:hypothetical protein